MKCICLHDDEDHAGRLGSRPDRYCLIDACACANFVKFVEPVKPRKVRPARPRKPRPSELPRGHCPRSPLCGEVIKSREDTRRYETLRNVNVTLNADLEEALNLLGQTFMFIPKGGTAAGAKRRKIEKMLREHGRLGLRSGPKTFRHRRKAS